MKKRMIISLVILLSSVQAFGATNSGNINSQKGVINTTEAKAYQPVKIDDNIRQLEITIFGIKEREVGENIEFLIEYEQNHNVGIHVTCHEGGKVPQGFSNSSIYSLDKWYLYAKDQKNQVTFKVPKIVLKDTTNIGLWFSKGAVSESIYIEEEEVRRLKEKYVPEPNNNPETLVTLEQEKNEIDNVVIHDVVVKAYEEMYELKVKLTTNEWTKIGVNYQRPEVWEFINDPITNEWVSFYLNKDAFDKAEHKLLRVEVEERERGQNIYFFDIPKVEVNTISAVD